jgi:hypothetical protein
MPVFTVFAPPDVTDGSMRQAETMVFVKDKFSRAAVAFGPFWMAATGRWIGVAFYVVAFSILALLLKALGLWPQAFGISYLALNLIFAHEEATLHGLFLEARGWREAGVVEAETLEDAEQRFFASWPHAGDAVSSLSHEAGAPTDAPPGALASLAEPISSVIARVPALRQRFRHKGV